MIITNYLKQFHLIEKQVLHLKMICGVFKSFFSFIGRMWTVWVSVEVITVKNNQTTSYGKQTTNESELLLPQLLKKLLPWYHLSSHKKMLCWFIACVWIYWKIYPNKVVMNLAKSLKPLLQELMVFIYLFSIYFQTFLDFFGNIKEISVA